MMKRILTIMALAGMGILVVSPARMSAQETSPLSVVTTYIREYPGNAALEFFSDDAVVRIVPPPPGTSGVWTGKEEIRTGLFPFGQSQNTRPEIIGSPVVEGNKVTVRVMVQTNDFKRLGVGRVEHTNEVVVEGGKIKSFTSTMIPSERERIAAAVAARQAQAGQPPAGMPRTGDEQPMPYFLIIMSGMLAALVGLALRRDTRPVTSSID